MPDSRTNPLQEHVGDLLEILPRLIQLGSTLNRGGLADRGMRASGVTIDRPSMTVLTTLLVAGQPLRVGEIADRMHVAGPHVTRLVHELERRGLATRVTDPADRRARQVELTQSGTDAATGYIGGVFGWFGEALTDWSPEDIKSLGKLLTRLVDDVNAHAAQAAPPEV